MNSTLKIKPLQSFSFKHTVYSHGWAALEPNKFDKETNVLIRTEKTNTNKVVLLTITGNEDYKSPEVKVKIESQEKLNNTDRKEIRDKVVHMLRIDEDFNEFYALCKKKGGQWETLTHGIGRLMRSPTLFEDIVKTICTTNVQWGGTKGMINRLVEFYGAPYPPERSYKSFPDPQKLARSKYDKFDSQVRMGYRSEYIHLLARQISKKEIDIDILFSEDLPTEELRKNLLSIKGIGNYAAATLLMLIGRYDYIPVDTVFRDFMKKKYFKKNYPSDEKAISLYADWGKWKFLAYWFDLWQFHTEEL